MGARGKSVGFERMPDPKGKRAASVLIVSGGVGSSGEQLVRTALAQFPSANVPVVLMPHVRTMDEVGEAVDRAEASGSIIVHTLVDPRLRPALSALARVKKVTAIDLMGELLDHLAEDLGQSPMGQPGLYRQLHKAYFERMDAIEFAVAHDDGLRASELPLAEIVLVGVSRSGKTPLSMYLSVLGWKVANVPWIKDIDLPPELLEIDRRRVVALSIEPGQLVAYRQWRQRRLGVAQASDHIWPARR